MSPLPLLIGRVLLIPRTPLTPDPTEAIDDLSRRIGYRARMVRSLPATGTSGVTTNGTRTDASSGRFRAARLDKVDTATMWPEPRCRGRDRPESQAGSAKSVAGVGAATQVLKTPTGRHAASPRSTEQCTGERLAPT